MHISVCFYVFVCCHLESGMYGGSPLTLSLPVLAHALEMFRSTENTWRPLQGSTASQTLGPLHLWPHLSHWHHVCWEKVFYVTDTTKNIFFTKIVMITKIISLISHCDVYILLQYNNGGVTICSKTKGFRQSHKELSRTTKDVRHTLMDWWTGLSRTSHLLKDATWTHIDKKTTPNDHVCCIIICKVVMLEIALCISLSILENRFSPLCLFLRFLPVSLRLVSTLRCNKWCEVTFAASLVQSGGPKGLKRVGGGPSACLSPWAPFAQNPSMSPHDLNRALNSASRYQTATWRETLKDLWLVLQDAQNYLCKSVWKNKSVAL